MRNTLVLSAAVLVSVEEWDRREAREELLAAILRGERDFTAGDVVEEDEALAELRAAASGGQRKR